MIYNIRVEFPVDSDMLETVALHFGLKNRTEAKDRLEAEMRQHGKEFLTRCHALKEVWDKAERRKEDRRKEQRLDEKA